MTVIEVEFCLQFESSNGTTLKRRRRAEINKEREVSGLV